MAIFYVNDFGAIANDGKDDTAAIQAALDAARDNAGQDTVVLGSGTYDVSGSGRASDGALRIYSDTEMYGNGMGESTIKVIDGYSSKITGILRTPVKTTTENVFIHDFTIDGNRDNLAEGTQVDGFFSGYLPGVDKASKNITIDSVEMMNVSRFGFDPHEQTDNLIITNSIAHNNGAGFVIDYVTSGYIGNNISYNNDKHGFSLVTKSSNITLENNIAYGNGENGIVVQRSSEAGNDFYNIKIIGGEYYNNGQEGILTKVGSVITIDGVKVYGNGKDGIRIQGTDDAIIKNSTIFNNGQNSDGSYYEVRTQRYDDTNGATGKYISTSNVAIYNNTIYNDSNIKTKYGIYEADDGTDFTIATGNNLSGEFSKGDYQLNGKNSTFTAEESGGDSGGGIDNGNIEPVFNEIIGTSKKDKLKGTDDNDFITGGRGNDKLYGKDGDDILDGGAGNDFFRTGLGADTVNGGDGIDRLTYTKSTEAVIVSLNSGLGLGGDAAGDVISSIEYLEGSNFNDILETSLSGNDRLGGKDGDDLLIGGNGNNLLIAHKGNDTLLGGGGKDRLKGGDGDDLLDGGDGKDKLYGGKGNDTLLGGDGSDRLKGGDGDDLLDGGDGKDKLYGGKGDDIFIVTDSTRSEVDWIMDFVQGEDIINVSGMGFDSVDDMYIFSSGGSTRVYSYDLENDASFRIKSELDLLDSDFIF